METPKIKKAILRIDCESMSFRDFNKISRFYIFVGTQKIECEENHNIFYYRMVYKLCNFYYLQYDMTKEKYYKLPTFICVDFNKKNS